MSSTLGQRKDAMEERDDSSLLHAIARDRDHSALTQFFQRYQHDAYNLARIILHDSAQADDAVQEAMLSVWLTASSFRPDGNARGWLLSIVTTKSLKMIRGQSRRAKREERIAMERSGLVDASSQDSQSGELAAVLRTHIEELPELERQMLACCYGAGMPHQKIAELFEMSRSRVTEKIQLALARLRGSLTKAGVAAIAPLMIEENIFHAVTRGHTCPPGMAQRVADHIAAKSRKAARNLSGRMHTTVSHTRWIVGIAIVATTAAATFAWPMLNRSVSTPSETGSAPKPGNGTPLNRQWTFQQGPAADLKVIDGSWEWKRQTDGAGVMDVPADRTMALPLPVLIPQQPVKITITKNCFNRTGGAVINAIWTKGLTALPYQMYFKQIITDRGRTVTEMYLIGRHIVHIESGHDSTIYEYERPFPSDEIRILLRNTSVYSIEVKTVLPEDLPASIRDVDVLIKTRGVAAIPGSDSGKTLPSKE